MPSLDHEAPLVVLREQPALVAMLLRDVLGVALPPFASVELADTNLTQALPAELRADMVVYLRGEGPDRAPVVGVIVEIQRRRDDGKWRSWPLYVASLHARLGCPVYLVVLATDQATARWAAGPIPTMPTWSFTPMVIGPDLVPRVPVERAQEQPGLTVLSALVHGHRPDGRAGARATLAALAVLPRDLARLCYDLICYSLDEPERRLMEDAMQYDNYEYKSDFARRHIAEGHLGEARVIALTFAERYGDVAGDLRARVEACDDLHRLRSLIVELATAADLAAVERMLTSTLPQPSH